MSRFDDKNKMKAFIVDWGKAGDYLEGTFVSAKHNIETQYGLNTLYEFRVREGECHLLTKKVAAEEVTVMIAGDIWGIWGRNDIFNGLMNRLRPGQKVQIEFIEERESRLGNDQKMIEIYNDGTYDQEYLDSLEVDAKDVPL